MKINIKLTQSGGFDLEVEPTNTVIKAGFLRNSNMVSGTGS
jgi:hypothetical protein